MSDPIKILWLGKSQTNGDGGEEIYDRKIIAELRAIGAAVSIYSPERVSRLRELANLARGVPHYRTWYDSRANLDGLKRAAEAADVVIASWEPFDRLAARVQRPVIPVLHNVTSQALNAIHPGHPAVRLAAWRAGRWERNAYSSGRFARVGLLSRDDAHYFQRVLRSPRLVYTPPGMPPLRPLAAGARFLPELLISGTYDWTPKRRDILAFAQDYAERRTMLPVRADRLPEPAERHLRPKPIADTDFGAAIRLGLIPDTFRAGHKLKTTYYIAHNAVVLSRADVRGDFAGIPDHETFIRLVGGPADVEAVAADFARMAPGELEARFRAFKAACAERFSWARSARTLYDAAREAASLRSRALSEEVDAGSSKEGAA